MARTDNLNNFLTDVANSLRAKTETTGKISASEFDKVIANIETGSEPVLQEKTIEPTTSKQIVTSDSDYDGLSKVTVSGVTNTIDSNIQPTNIKKGVSILGVNGSLEEGTIPTETLNITSNGIYDVKDYASADVNVGSSAITKGVIVNACNSSGYATDVSIVGLTTLPAYYFATYSSTYLGFINKYLKKVSSSSIKTINNNAFYNVKSLTEINMPNLTSIGNYAFYNCNELILNELPDTITSIGKYAFYYCEKITLTKLPSSLTSIDEYAFRGCSGLINLTIPSGVASIGKSCFVFCSSLQEVYLEGNTELQYQSFGNCSNLTKVVYKNATKVPECVNGAFEFSAVGDGTGYIYVPDSLLEDWKVASGWSTYASQIKGLSELE